jgi:YegS/Rv2252/BmrU family lipid kinase
MKNLTTKEKIHPIWQVIVNPNAGHGKGRKDWSRISSLLEKYGISFQVCFTEARRHAIVIANKAVKSGFRKFIVVGGDGTLNEVVNGVFSQRTCPGSDITLGMIMVGTGNDWGRLFGIPSDYESAVNLIHEGKTRLQDAGIVYYYHGTSRQKRYFINIAGLGFDAVVVKRTNLQKEKGRSGKALYFYNLLRSLLQYKHTHVTVEIDGKKSINDVFTISIGIGKYSGGGMMQTPNAIPDDGLFDVTVIKNIRKGEVIRSLKMLYNGSILDHPKIEGHRGRVVLIDSDPLIHLEADGESLGHSPIELRSLPRSINIIYGQFPLQI